MKNKRSDFVDLTGQTMNHWAVLELAPMRPNSPTAHWVCQCECGTIREVSGSMLKSGGSRSCGCFGRGRPKSNAPLELQKNQKNPLYSIWKGMRQRCTDSNCSSFKNYGARGITVCERWSDFGAFVEDMHPRPVGMSLDRIDNDKGYSPENCRWATPLTQGQNRRAGSRINKHEWKGATMCVAAIARLEGVSIERLRFYLKKGLPIQEAVAKAVPSSGQLIDYGWRTRCELPPDEAENVPVRQGKRTCFQWNGILQDVYTICQKEDVSYVSVRQDIRNGVGILQAVRNSRYRKLKFTGERTIPKYGKKLINAAGKGMEMPRDKPDKNRIKGEGKLRKRLEWCRNNGVTYRGTEIVRYSEK